MSKYLSKIVNLDSECIPFQNFIKLIKQGHIIHPLSKVYILYDDETIREDISRDVVDFSLSVTYQSGQRRNLNLNLVNKNHKYTPSFINGLIQIGTKVRLDLGFIINGISYYKQMGIFLLYNPNAARETSNQTISFSLCDKFGLLDGTILGKTGLRDIIPVDVPMYSAFTTMLTADRGNGLPYDTKSIIFNSRYKNQKTYYTIKKDAGYLLGDSFIEMAQTISSDVYYNEYGHMCVESNVNEFLGKNLPLVWHFSENDKNVISLSISENSSNIINTVIVKGNIVNGYQFSAKSENKNPLSPTCVQYRGSMYEIIQDQSLYSDELCMDRAQYELLNYTRGTKTCNIVCNLLPIWDVNQMVLIDYPSEGIKNELYAIDSLAYSKDGNMSITLSNMDEVIF